MIYFEDEIKNYFKVTVHDLEAFREQDLERGLKDNIDGGLEGMLGQLMQGFLGGGAPEGEAGQGGGMPADLAKMLGGAGGGSNDDDLGRLLQSVMGP